MMRRRLQSPPDIAPAAIERSGELALAAKYSCQGPRYTSNPTAPQFRRDFSQEEYFSWQRGDGAHRRAPISLYVHLPFCRNICYYCACNKIVTRDEGAARAYLHYLKGEIEMQAQLVGSDRAVTQMHWGGGTPTFLDHAEITELMHALASNFRLLDQGEAEYSIEIDPRTVQRDTIALLKGLGFNRISLGVQDFDPLVQKAVNRIQPYQQVEPLVACIRRHAFRSLSFDLIHGLPHQDCHTMEETLKRIIALRPDRIACYKYAHLPDRFSSQRAIDRLDLPGPEENLLLQQLINHRLQDAGYLYIGMDHYALPADDLAIAQREGRLQRNFQGYSTRLADDLLGLGVSAISQIGDFYLQNECELESYYGLLDQGKYPVTRGYKVNREDKLRRHIIMRLICDLRLDIGDCNRRFGVEFAERFDEELGALRAMERDGLLQLDAEEIRITASGRPFLRNVCMVFDAYLKTPGDDRQSSVYSTTI
jgi:oxygen-independent coproporphyrinogen-3 oxidase